MLLFPWQGPYQTTVKTAVPKSLPRTTLWHTPPITAPNPTGSRPDRGASGIQCHRMKNEGGLVQCLPGLANNRGQTFKQGQALLIKPRGVGVGWAGTAKRQNLAHLCVCVIIRERVCLKRAIAGLMGKVEMFTDNQRASFSFYSFVKCCLHMYVGVGVFLIFHLYQGIDSCCCIIWLPVNTFWFC